MTTTETSPIAVLGATGKTGRRVATRLAERGVAFRRGSRSASPPFDWEDPATWAPAFAGTSAAYLSYYPDLAAPGAAAAIGALARVAVAGGTTRLVLLSGRGEEEAQAAERELMASGAQWTVVRCSWFMQNFSESFFLEPVLAGDLALPVGDVPEPFVDVDDIADVVVAALTGDGHAGEVYELTGPRALTFAEAVGTIAAATGRDVRLTRVDMEDYAAGAAQAGVPDDVVGLLRHLFTEVLDGRNARPADGVQRALGRPPQDFATYARAAAATGVWGGVASLR